MKRYIAVLLAALMIFTLFAACSKAETPAATDAPAATQAPAATKAPATEAPAAPAAKTIPERIKAGEHPLVAYAAQSTNDSFLLGIITSVGERLTADGFTYQYVSAETNTATQIAQIENFLSMGAVAIIVSPMTADSVKDISLKAMNDGCYIVYLGSTPKDFEISGLVNIDNSAVGKAAAEMSLKWVDTAHPDGVKTALYRYSTNTEMLSRTDAMEAVYTADGRVNIVFKKDLAEGTVDAGYNGAEEAMTYDPEIRLFACFSSSVALGASNYIIAQTGLKLDDFAAFGSEDSEDARAAIDLSKSGQSILRGLISYGGANPADTLYQCTYDLLMGVAQPPHYCFDAVHTYNVVGYETAE